MHVHLSRTLLSAAFWTSCYYCVKWLCRSDAEKTDRFIALIHSLVDSVLCIASFYVGPQMFQNYGEANTHLQEVTFVTCFGFYMFDICWQLKHNPKDTAMLAHHALSLVAISYMLGSGKSGNEGLMTLFLMEVSHPFLQARWFLNDLDQRHTILNTINELLFWSIFVASRIVAYSHVAFTVVTCDEPNIYIGLFAVGFYFVSTVLSLQYLFKKVLKKSTIQWLKDWVSTSNSSYDLDLVKKSLRKNSLHADSEWSKLAAKQL